MHYINNSIPFMPHDTVAFPPLYTPSTDTYTDKHFNVYRLPADSAPPHSYWPNLKVVATAPARNTDCIISMVPWLTAIVTR